MRNKAVIYMVVAAMLLSLGGVSFYYWYKNTHFVDTEDARVDGIIVKVSPQISGIITEMYVEEGDLLQNGAFIARQVDYTLSPDANMDLSLIKSPISGTVIKKIGNVGEVGVPGSPVAMLADLNNLYITANIEETELARLNPARLWSLPLTVHRNKDSGRVLSIGEAWFPLFRCSRRKIPAGALPRWFSASQ